MEQLKEKLNRYVALYGPLDKRTLEVSREVDKLIVEKMREGKDK
ncbi:aspartyl-phosphate phosphatase Spo0E family protein [Clostridium sp. Mt-5]|uniref:Aspartyl-phosphate phosphatase Spo0E family protein n=1 Tax=Clostridium moutaii TaxID=3240932 RepID=A0ABV4BIN6_9CLOT